MANASIAQSISRRTVVAALAAARVEAAEHNAWINAINKAALNLEASPWAFDGEILRLASASRLENRYTVTPEGCECKAGQQVSRAGIGQLASAAQGGRGGAAGQGRLYRGGTAGARR